ncbi:MAG: hypothetical protein V1836_01355 [Candidatus Aenigmatarchaeota archaeon]
MKKGITPVISLIMLMLITVGMVGVAYAWFSNLLTTQTEKGISIPPGGSFCAAVGGNNKISILIQNNGATSDISTAVGGDVIILQIDGTDVGSDVSRQSVTIPAGSGKLIVNGYACGGTACTAGVHNIRVGTRTGIVESSAYCK